MRKTYAAKLRNVLSASIASDRLSEVLNELSADELEFIAHDWELWARDEQLAPSLIGASDSRSASRPEAADLLDESRATSSAPGGRHPGGESPGANKQWRVWLLLGGRGSGKTRAGAEWVRSIVGDDKQARIALVGKTLGDVRNVMIEGQSGLLAIHPAHERPEFEPSKRRLTWPNGAVAELFSADEAEALRGPQFTAAWCDELAKWRGAERAWDMLQFALRLGEAPRVCVTTTPRATKLLKQIIADEATVTVNIATADNATNLAPTFIAEMTRRYAGSAIGRQELLGEIVEDASDGLWRRHWIEEARVETAPEMQRVVVALDPPVTATASSDACGIVVAGLGVDKRAYVLADRTVQGRTPELWARAALGAYDDYEADRMVAEVNQGGDLVISVLQQFRENFPVVKVRATRGKWVRAEPVAALYAEGRVAHAGRFDALEDQMCTFGADGTVKGRSPDRADALVWAITDLLLSDKTKPSVRML
ncbi:MAG: DNA-packaging protein [Proteobacteria bacterium]|nr:DNA-packaging protein [Pseudomonadota bacterium]